MSASNGGEPGLDPHGAASEHPAVDVLLAAAVTAMHILVVARTGRADVLSWVESPQRQTLYGAAAGVIAIIGSLGAIALAQYHPGDGDRSKAVRRLYGRALRRNWRAILTITGLSSGLCLVALAIDRESDPFLAASSSSSHWRSGLFASVDSSGCSTRSSPCRTWTRPTRTAPWRHLWERQTTELLGRPASLAAVRRGRRHLRDSTRVPEFHRRRWIDGVVGR